MKISIKEKSQLARLTSRILRKDNMAIVVGATIYLWNTGKDEFLENKKWLQHELVHVQQFRQYGFVRFIFLYILESLKKGYYKNRFEVEARMKENDDKLLPYIRP